MVARFARFYGWPLDQILGLNVDEFDQLYRAIASIEAHEFLLALKAQDWPNMKENARSKLHSKMAEVAYSATRTGPAKAKKLTNEELAKILNKR
jgi:hypothetical protein